MPAQAANRNWNLTLINISHNAIECDTSPVVGVPDGPLDSTEQLAPARLSCVDHGMQHVSTIRVREGLVTRTVEALRVFGRNGNEGFVVWVGTISGVVAHVTDSIVPPQNSIRNESGVGYFIDGATLFALNKLLHQERVTLIAQVHSHPTEAYHSQADDAYAVVTAEGGVSIVVPDFARGRPNLNDYAVYRLRQRKWTPLSSRDIAGLFVTDAVTP